MKMKKLLTILLAASIVAGSAQVPGLTMQVQAAQVQTQESAGSATATYNGKTFNRASAAYQDGDVAMRECHCTTEMQRIWMIM